MRPRSTSIGDWYWKLLLLGVVVGAIVGPLPWQAVASSDASALSAEENRQPLPCILPVSGEASSVGVDPNDAGAAVTVASKRGPFPSPGKSPGGTETATAAIAESLVNWKVRLQI